MAKAMSNVYNFLRNAIVPQYPVRRFQLSPVTSFQQSLVMSGKINIIKWNSSNDGKICEENMIKKLEKMGCKWKKLAYTPGMDFDEHVHPMVKMDGITTGRFQMRMFGKDVVLEPGDIIEVPKETVHSAKVVGNETVIFFDSEKTN